MIRKVTIRMREDAYAALQEMFYDDQLVSRAKRQAPVSWNAYTRRLLLSAAGLELLDGLHKDTPTFQEEGRDP